MSSEFSEENLNDLLPLYYKRIFPCHLFYRWLSYGNEQYFAKRELSFTLLGDIYIRFQSFDTMQEFTAELQKKYPEKIDIGAVYSGKPKERKRCPSFAPSEKELVFDIDLTDYDTIRSCCQGAQVCLKCWKFMVIACKILDATLREDFGYKHFLWVFSGRRGVHLWVCDESARKLTETHREAVANYIQVITKKFPQFYGDRIHSSLKRALSIIDKYFIEVTMQDQDILGTEKGLEAFLKPIDDQELKIFLSEGMKKGKTSEEKWTIFNKLFEQRLQAKQIPPTLRTFREATKLHYTYPRIDIKVSEGLNHLLKAPFCVHPKTGKVCIPFSIKLVGKFDPHKVPKVNELVDEINAYDAKTKEQEAAVETGNVASTKIKDYKKTSLLKSVGVFEEFLRQVTKTEEIESMDF